MSISETFPAAELNGIQHEARKLDRIPGYEYEPDAWQINPANPSRLMPLFHPLRLKDGFVLRAYLQDGHLYARGLVYAIPATSLFPEAEDCMRANSQGMIMPIPEDALINPMLAIECGNTPRAFLMASLLRRELREFGARCHGLNWRMHTIIDEKIFCPDNTHLTQDTLPWDPVDEKTLHVDTDNATFMSENDTIDLTGSDWEHFQPIPEDMRPRVRITRRGGAEVEYYTYSPAGMESIYRHFEVYAPNDIIPKTSCRILARGSRGLTH